MSHQFTPYTVYRLFQHDIDNDKGHRLLLNLCIHLLCLILFIILNRYITFTIFFLVLLLNCVFLWNLDF